MNTTTRIALGVGMLCVLCAGTSHATRRSPTAPGQGTILRPAPRRDVGRALRRHPIRTRATTAPQNLSASAKTSGLVARGASTARFLNRRLAKLAGFNLFKFCTKSCNSRVSSGGSGSSSSNKNKSSKKSYPDWNKAVTIRYGEEKSKRSPRYHRDYGYFNKKTEVAEDYMYQTFGTKPREGTIKDYGYFDSRTQVASDARYKH